MKKFILVKDRDEIVEVQGKIVLVPPYKEREEYFIGMEYYAGKKIVRQILGTYDEKTSKDIFKAILVFLGSNTDFTFVMPIKFVE